MTQNPKPQTPNPKPQNEPQTVKKGESSARLVEKDEKSQQARIQHITEEELLYGKKKEELSPDMHIKLAPIARGLPSATDSQVPDLFIGVERRFIRALTNTFLVD